MLKFFPGSADTQGMDGHLRRYAASFFVAAAFLIVAVPAAAQGFGVGGRLAWIKNDSALDLDSARFFGGQIRLSGARIGVEVSLDRHTTSLELLNQKVTETPLQVSLLLNLSSSKFRPYLLGGPGWYYRSVSAIEGSGDFPEINTHEFGWHGGIGAEIRAGRHFGFHGDYRYTFLDFNSDDDQEIGSGIIGSLLPGHRGSMITLGATLYF